MNHAGRHNIGIRPHALKAWPAYAVWGGFCPFVFSALSNDLGQIPGMPRHRRTTQSTINNVDNGAPGDPSGYRERLLTDR